MAALTGRTTRIICSCEDLLSFRKMLPKDKLDTGWTGTQCAECCVTIPMLRRVYTASPLLMLLQTFAPYGIFLSLSSLSEMVSHAVMYADTMLDCC